MYEKGGVGVKRVGDELVFIVKDGATENAPVVREVILHEKDVQDLFTEIGFVEVGHPFVHTVGSKDDDSDWGVSDKTDPKDIKPTKKGK